MGMPTGVGVVGACGKRIGVASIFAAVGIGWKPSPSRRDIDRPPLTIDTDFCGPQLAFRTLWQGSDRADEASPYGPRSILCVGHQASVRRTASRQPVMSCRRVLDSIVGSKQRFNFHVAANPFSSGHTPACTPASHAAPNAVVSSTWGRCTGRSRMSAKRRRRSKLRCAAVRLPILPRFYQEIVVSTSSSQS